MLELNINDNSVYRLNDVIKIPSTYTFSIWYKTNKNTKITFNVLGDKNQISSGTSWKKFVKTVEVDEITETNDSIDIEIENGSIGHFYEAYLSEGVSDTSWSPAPEDIDDNIESVKSEFTQTAEEIKMSVKNIKGDVSNLNIQVGKIEQSVADNKGNISSLTTTVSGINTTVKKQGESISNINQKADKISQQVTSVKSELNSKIELTAGEITQKVDDVRADLSAEIKQTSDKISQTVTDMNKNLSTRIDQTAKDIELNASKTEEIGNSLNNLDIGGRNLLLNTGFNTFNHWIKGGNAKSLQMVNGWCEVTIGGAWSGFVQEFIPEKNVEYIVSYEAYLVDTVAETSRLETDFGTPDQNQTINKTPAKYSLKLKYPSTYVNGEIDFKLSNNEVGKKWRIRKIKLEKGNKATDWSPAPEDVDEKIDDIQIGGRNILKNSKNGIVCTGTDYSSTTTPGATITTKATGIGNAHRFIEGFYTTPVTELSKRVGTEFAFSLDVKITGSFTNLRTKVDFRDTSHNSSIFSNFIGINGLEVGKWTRVSGVASVKEVANVTATRSLFLFDWSNSTVGSTIEYRNLQLEEGNKSTAWTPAPEDIENDLKNNYYTKTQTDAQIKVSSDSITSTVKKEIATEVGKINVGGRNLLMNTRDFGGNKWILAGTSTLPVYDTDGMYYIGVVNTWSNYAKQTINIDPGEYIISLYAKSSKQAVLEIKDDSSIHNYVIGNITVSSNTWEKYTLSFKNTYATYPFEFTLLTRQNTSTIYVKKIKLEKGNKATDWSPAPEDMATADSLADVNSSLTDATNDLQSNINSTNKNLQDIQNSQNEVYEIVSQNKSQISSLTQRAEGFTMDFKTVNETVKQINNQFVTERDERYKYIKFIDGEIWLGKEVPIGEDDFKLVIKNDRISFLQNKAEVAYMSNNKLYVTDIHVTSSLQLGRFVLSSRANGNVGLRWIGN